MDEICWEIPEDYVGDYAVEMSVRDKNGEILSTNSTTIIAAAQ